MLSGIQFPFRHSGMRRFGAGPESILRVVIMDSGLARFTRALSDKRNALARGMTTHFCGLFENRIRKPALVADHALA
jgi:hypothetical protein